MCRGVVCESFGMFASMPCTVRSRIIIFANVKVNIISSFSCCEEGEVEEKKRRWEGEGG